MLIKQHNIVYITDSNYLLPTKVSIRSAIKNSENKKVHIIVVCIDLSKDEIKELEKLGNDQVSINTYNTEYDLLEIGNNHEHVTRTALYKFKLAELLKDIDVVLYLDGDTMLSLGYLSIFDYDISEKYMAAIRDMYVEKIDNRTKYIGNKYYYNSGVMLLNLEKIRRDNCMDKLIEYKKNEKDHTYMDQDAINKVLGVDCLSLSPNYNFLSIYKEMFQVDIMSEFYKIDISEMKKIYDKPYIYHMASHNKPWTNFFCSEANKWFSYLSDDEFREMISTYFKKGILKYNAIDLYEQIYLIKYLKDTVENQANCINDLQEQITNLQEQITNIAHRTNYIQNRTLFGAMKRIIYKIKGE